MNEFLRSGPDIPAGLTVMLGFSVFLIGISVGAATMRAQCHAEAVKAGAAHYEADPTTGEVRFVYNPKCRP